MRWLLLWTALMLFYAWWDHKRVVCSWHVHRPMQRVERTVRFKPIRFNDTSIIWMNSVVDEIDLTLVQTAEDTLGDVAIDKLQMHIFNDANRTELGEITELDVDTFVSGTWNMTFLQGDVNLSPFRRLVVYPRVDWDLGGDACRWCGGRRGMIYGDKWMEVRPWWWGRWVLYWSIGVGVLIGRSRNRRYGRRKRITS